ncbi:MAG: hypothetical protein COT74_00530 [Bdellovibrionales bacterium CG10_big_fil_rev_8_21_14_0_10_45_34]|nr:MAG: hypothetical protein COT74_00530 [Bdellovibrionales bacterium CG10_big_fil_rev_8_21_14_0_10_45_34]
MNSRDVFSVGVGLRPTHYPYLEGKPDLSPSWFEAISENYMNSEGRPLEMLLRMREDYPIALHGVALSIGSAHGIDAAYVKQLKRLVERVDPFIVSDHLCWGQSPSGQMHDLLPIPFNKASLELIVENVDQVQNILGRPILLENISYYLRFRESDMDEAVFMIDLCNRSGCKLLLDLNNIYVNSVNHGFDAQVFTDRIPVKLIGQIHLAGPSQEEGFLFDTHSTSVPEKVWQLYESVLRRGASAPTLIEWDQDIPGFDKFEAEVDKATSIIQKCENAVGPIEFR